MLIPSSLAPQISLSQADALPHTCAARLAMIGIAGMIGQELATGEKLFA